MNKTARRVLIILSLLGLAVSGTFLCAEEAAALRGRQKDRELASLVHTAEAAETGGTLRLEPEPEPNILPQYAPLYAQNGDLAGWLRIEGTVIDYPVMYTPKNQNYYLHVAFDGGASDSGTLFIGGPWSEGNNNTIIYGHNMRDGSMLAGLVHYADESYGREHSLIRFDTLYETGEYELVAAFYSQVYDEGGGDGAFRYYDYPVLSRRESFEYYVKQAKTAALYDTGVTPAWGDKLLTLSTCGYHAENGRFVVVARLLRSETDN